VSKAFAGNGFGARDHSPAGLDHQSLRLLSASLLWRAFFCFLSVATAIAFGLVIPLLSLNRRNAARKAEQKFPEFQERLLTLAEKPMQDPFTQLARRRHHARGAIERTERLASNGPILGFLAFGRSRVAVLIWLINAGPGYLGYGTSLLWAGAPKSGNHALLRHRGYARRSRCAPLRLTN